MSALPPIADISGVSTHVRFVPKADIQPLTQLPRRLLLAGIEAP
jgi:hypothetical protein